jgi:DNA-binding NarL/FixJ family response regulator
LLNWLECPKFAGMEFHEYQIIIADNQFLIVESLQKLLSDSFNGTTGDIVSNKYDMVRILKQYPRVLLILDPNLMDFDNLSELRGILQEHKCKVLVLTNILSKNDITELIAAGIKNILLKTAEREEILTALRSTLAGKKYFCQEALDIFTEIAPEKGLVKETGSLTHTETEIVKCIAEGLTTKQIAMHKHISFHTVMTHRKNIFRKLNVNNASELVMYAIRAGIIDTIEYHI